MDPLTHTLVGANLSSTALGRKTRLAAAALVIGANLPDVDSVLYFTGHSDLALGFRRGWTHGILAIVVLPFILTAALLLYDRLRPLAGRTANPRWLLALSAIGVLTHPFLDWLNNYGMRWLMPFRGDWSYGDSVYIMDPLLWLVLGVGWLAGRAPTRWLVGGWLFFTVAVGWVVAQRSAAYLAIVALVSLILLAALFWRSPRSLSAAALIVGFVYIGGRLAINAATVEKVSSIMQPEAGAITSVMASPQPLDPTRWDVVVQTSGGYRFGRYSWREGGLTLAPDVLPLPAPSPEWERARADPSVRGFMTWVRYPWYEIERTPESTRVLIHDARYATRRRPGGGFGGVVVELPRDVPPR
ncbi:MAG TPA: metal-dependent hydrolase [Thermoanaerobaculia bacterium]